MQPSELDRHYRSNQNEFHKFISNIKKTMQNDIYSVINTTIISNPYATAFPKKFFLTDYKTSNKFFIFLRNSSKFNLRQFYFLLSYLIGFVLYKIYYKKNNVKFEGVIGIDVFFLVDNIIKDGKFNEDYFFGLYDVLDKYDRDYIFIPRLYGISKNPFKLIKLFKILNKDKRNCLFEFDLLSMRDFITLFFMVLVYPFKTLRLLQKEKTEENILFNNELINDISSIGFDAFTRYIYGKNIANLNKIHKIYSWSEFQVIERSFNYGIRTNSGNIKLYGCQFFINYKTYFNAYVDDLDYTHKTSFHEVLVNGKYYILDRNYIKYKEGVSLRYNSVFLNDIKVEGSDVLLLGSYIQVDTKYMLKSVASFDNVLFKNHPAIDISKYGKLNDNITIVNDNIYELFNNTSLVIGTASGTSVEAVACGVSVIIIASQDNLTANPLVDYGKGKIWDIAFSKGDIKELYNNLVEYRENNIGEIQEIASWYKDNFFIKPTEENIVRAFEL